jgi:hypothetical protein
MKKLFVSVGLVALGTASLYADDYAPGLGPMQTTKLWSVSGTLRGFYDSNYATAPNTKGSYGFEVSPEVQLSMPLQQTELGLRYIYGLYYYTERENLGQDPIDQSHELDLWLDHAFTERWQATAEDTAVVGQEPQLLQAGTPFRVDGNNLANVANFSLTTQWTKLLSSVLTYQNSFYDFENHGAGINDVLPPGFPFFGTGKGASLAGLLNRDDNTVGLNLDWQLTPETIGIIGGSFEQDYYLGNEPIAYSPLLGVQTGNPLYYSRARDARTYTGYLGVQQYLLQNLCFSVNAGAQYTDDYNDPLYSADWAPYVTLSLVYTYLPGSYAQIGFNQTRSATDIVTPTQSTLVTGKLGSMTADQENSVVFATINQEITPKLMATVIGNVQYGVFEGGAYDSMAETWYSLGVNLAYTFTEHFSADAGYNYDNLQSNIPGYAYVRNRVYLGATVTY